LPEPEANTGTQQPCDKGLRNGREGWPRRHGLAMDAPTGGQNRGHDWRAGQSDPVESDSVMAAFMPAMLVRFWRI